MESKDERLKTYQPAVLQDICASSFSQTQPQASTCLVSPGTAAWSGWQARKAAQRAVLEAQARSKEEAFRAAMQRKQAQVAADREANFQSLYSEVLDGLVNGSGIMAEMQEVLDHSNAVHHTRQAGLYQQWSSQVFDKIQQRIQAGMSRTSIQQLESSLKAASDDYIRATNTKQAVFHDVIIESDYDPLRPLSSSIRIATGDLVDPLKRDLLKTQAEKALLTTNTGSSPRSDGASAGSHPGSSSARSNRSSSPSSNSLAKASLRPTLEVQRWAAGQINATPYGHCIDGTGSYCIKHADPLDLAQKASHLHLDDYNPPPPPDPYRPSKHMTQPEVKGGRTGLFDIMQNSCHLSSPAITGGDAWLEQKGKKFVASSEVAMGRRGLAEVLQQSTNPYLDGRALDDAWLQPSGKQKVPGPEQRRGRPDLTEIIQQSSNAYVDGRSLGDAWLEQKGKRRVEH